MAAAGFADGLKEPLDFLVRDVASFKLWAQAIQAMLQEGLNVKCNLRTVVELVWFDDTASGQLRPGDRRHRVDPARPVGLF